MTKPFNSFQKVLANRRSISVTRRRILVHGGGSIGKLPSGAETVLCCFGFGEPPASALKTIEDSAKASQGGQVIVAATLKWDLKGK